MELTESPDHVSERTYAAYERHEHLSFDPLKDLNLPSSYEEVVARYAQLRGERESISMN